MDCLTIDHIPLICLHFPSMDRDKEFIHKASSPLSNDGCFVYGMDSILCIESWRWDGREIPLHCYCGPMISMISHTSTKHNGAIDVDYKSIPWHVQRLSHEANFTILNPRHHDTCSADVQTTLLQSPNCHSEMFYTGYSWKLYYYFYMS